MQYVTHNTREISIDGTYLRGRIETTHTQLLDVFGDSADGDGYKIDAEWIILFEDGEVATIYNWKNGFNYLGGEGKRVEDITDWHVGGSTLDAPARVKAILAEASEPCFLDDMPAPSEELKNHPDSKQGKTFPVLDKIAEASEQCFTPGPWGIEDCTPGESTGLRFAINAKDSIIARTTDGWRAAEANARLIAAAPEMLAQLKALMECADDIKEMYGLGTTWKTIRDLIAKIEG